MCNRSLMKKQDTPQTIMLWKKVNQYNFFIIIFQFPTGTPTSSDPPYALSPHNNGNYHSSTKSRPLLHSQRSRSISPSASPTRSRSRSKSPGNHHHVTLNAKASGSGHANVSITHHHHCCSCHGGHTVSQNQCCWGAFINDVTSILRFLTPHPPHCHQKQAEPRPKSRKTKLQTLPKQGSSTKTCKI